MKPGALLNFKKVLLKSVQQNVYASISPAKALLILKDIESNIPSYNPKTIKFIHYTTKDLRK